MQKKKTKADIFKLAFALYAIKATPLINENMDGFIYLCDPKVALKEFQETVKGLNE